MTTQQYCLRWNNHQPNFISVFSNLLNSESLVDVTLAAEGKHLQAHKVVLSACSSYFQSLFTVNPCQHPIVILKDVKFAHLKIIVNFMYYGEVNVSQEQLPCILKTAEMLKIKGLAEIPVDQSHKSYNNASERVDLLTPQDSNWSSGLPCQLVSPTPCALSPTSKRKRLRKSSTGSGSGSAEKNSDDCIPSELLLTAASATIIKSDPSSCNTENSNSLQTHSSESEMLLSGSHDNTDCTSPRQINLHIAQPQELNISDHKVSSPVEVCGTATASSHEALTEQKAPISQSELTPQSQQMGTKRGRFLMRQSRIKRESDPSQPIDGEPLSSQYLSIPPIRIERQFSEPLPAISPPPGNLLTIPGAVLTKQHSHPLLPSQTLQPLSPPLHIHIIPHSHICDTPEGPVSPVVVVSDPLNTSPLEMSIKEEGIATTHSLLRVRSEELKRSTSSPQSGGRSSHCPVVRPGPALGCNYCWNTVDTHGRILRRKTKYHCPECQTNLCIVPCFQEYHQRQGNTTQTDPIALTTSVMKMFPKTTSI